MIRRAGFSISVVVLLISSLWGCRQTDSDLGPRPHRTENIAVKILSQSCFRAEILPCG